MGSLRAVGPRARLAENRPWVLPRLLAALGQPPVQIHVSLAKFVEGGREKLQTAIVGAQRWAMQQPQILESSVVARERRPSSLQRASVESSTPTRISSEAQLLLPAELLDRAALGLMSLLRWRSVDVAWANLQQRPGLAVLPSRAVVRRLHAKGHGTLWPSRFLLRMWRLSRIIPCPLAVEMQRLPRSS